MKESLAAVRLPIVVALFLTLVVADAQAGPDLGFISLDVDEFEYHPGEDIRVDCSITNVGDEHSSEVVVTLYVSADTTITSDDLELHSYWRSSPGPGGSSNFAMMGQIDGGDLPAGEYYIGALVSCPGDTNPDNDTIYIDTPITFDGSDLTMTSMDFSGFSDSGPGEVWVDFCVENTGPWDADRYSVVFYASTDSTIDSDDYRLARVYSGSISSGESQCDGGALEFDGVPRGDYYVGAVIACDYDVDDLSNNVSFSSEMFSLYPLPDLVVREIRADSGVLQPGESISVYNIVIGNTGYGIADSYTLDFYASIDDDIGSGDYHIGRASGGSLEVGGQDLFATVTCELPSDIPGGDYFIGVIITCSDDGDVDNNQGATSDSSVQVGLPVDMVVQSVQVAAAAYSPDEEFVVQTLVKNIGGRESQSYTVDFYVSTDTVISSGDHRLSRIVCAKLPPGEDDHRETICRVPYSIPAGRYYVGIIVTVENEDDPENNVGRSTARVDVVHPPGYVCGHAEYRYRSNSDRRYPIRCALVQILEADDNDNPLDDRLIVETHTDPNGDYALTLSEDQGGQGDIYIRILAEGAPGAFPGATSRICAIKDDVFDETYSIVSTANPHPGDASTVINVTAPGNGEFAVFDSAVEGFIKARTFLDIEMEPATVYWPSEEGFSYYDPSDGGIYISQEDRRDRDVIMHEYGHVVAEVCGVGQGQVGEYPAHYWDMDLRDYPIARGNEHAMNLAFREGWATIFSIATQYGDTGYIGSGDSNYDDEEDEWTLKVDLDNIGEDDFIPGQYFENMNAGAMWDIFDDNEDGDDGDDTISDPSLVKIWTISRDYKPDNIRDFWDNWFGKYEHEQEMKYIFEKHNMSFPMPE